MADSGLVVGVVGSPERTKLAEQVGAFVGHLGRAEPIDGVGTRLLAHGLKLASDLVDRGIPGDAGPLSVYQLHRIAQPPLAVHQFAHGGAFGTMRAAIDRRIPARLLADLYPMQHLRSHGASNRAMRANALAN